jgi:hypothetical protein
MLHQLRAETAPKIFAQDPQFYAAKYERATLPHFKAELYFPESGDHFSKYAPILFPDRKKDMKVFLKCPYLAQVCYSYVVYSFLRCIIYQMLRTVLYGAQSLVDKKPSNTTVASLWNIKSVTPGSIALVAIFVCFYS